MQIESGTILREEDTRKEKSQMPISNTYIIATLIIILYVMSQKINYYTFLDLWEGGQPLHSRL